MRHDWRGYLWVLPCTDFPLPAVYCAAVRPGLYADTGEGAEGPIIVTGILVGGVLFVLGMYWSMCLAYCILGVVADLLAGSGNFRNKGRNLLSYMIFVLSPVFSYGMLWFDRDAYVQYLVEKGTEQTYMDTMVSTAQNWMLPAMIIGVLICAAISGLVGQKLLKKHFEKAGVV